MRVWGKDVKEVNSDGVWVCGQGDCGAKLRVGCVESCFAGSPGVVF